MTTIVQNIPMPTRFVDLPAYLTSLLEFPSISANGLRQLHRSLEETWEPVSYTHLTLPTILRV